jgi:hypothetical protein
MGAYICTLARPPQLVTMKSITESENQENQAMGLVGLSDHDSNMAWQVIAAKPTRFQFKNMTLLSCPFLKF